MRLICIKEFASSTLKNIETVWNRSLPKRIAKGIWIQFGQTFNHPRILFGRVTLLEMDGNGALEDEWNYYRCSDKNSTTGLNHSTKPTNKSRNIWYQTILSKHFWGVVSDHVHAFNSTSAALLRNSATSKLESKCLGSRRACAKSLTQQDPHVQELLQLKESRFCVRHVWNRSGLDHVRSC